LNTTKYNKHYIHMP